jgi:hypothetical protein
LSIPRSLISKCRLRFLEAFENPEEDEELRERAGDKIGGEKKVGDSGRGGGSTNGEPRVCMEVGLVPKVCMVAALES